MERPKPRQLSLQLRKTQKKNPANIIPKKHEKTNLTVIYLYNYFLRVELLLRVEKPNRDHDILLHTFNFIKTQKSTRTKFCKVFVQIPGMYKNIG